MKTRTTPLFMLAAVVTTIAALYFAKAILLPVAMAILLTFLLTPIADRLERWRIPRIVAVLLIVATSFVAFGTVVGMMTQQLVQLGEQLPNHELELGKKLRNLRPQSETLGKLSQTLSNLRAAILQSAPPDDGDPKQTETGEQQSKGDASDTVAKNESAPVSKEPSSAGAAPSKPVAVEMVDSTSPLFTAAREWLGQLAAPIGTAGLVIVLVLFMLLDRENQRIRVVQLFGRAHMHQTAEAVHDVSRRVGRYLRALFMLNAGYGVAVATGLWFLGVPGAVTWGVLGFSLRFLPYIGPWIAATLPILVSIATSPGWSQPLFVLGLYIAIELISNNVLEPLAYGSTTGISTVGVIISAIFWTWLWGPVGLILSMPMTVCLLVGARYVPQLRFISILLADRPPMTPAEHVYQRLLAFDDREPLKAAHKHVKESSLASYYDEVLLPALVMAENDRHLDLLNDDQSSFVIEATDDMVGELADVAAKEHTERLAAAAPDVAAHQTESMPMAEHARVFCIPLRDDGDEIASHMLVQLLTAEGFNVVAGAAASLTGEVVDRVAESDIDIVVISVLPPITARDSRLLWRRLRTRYPNLPIVVGFWTAANDKEKLAAPVEDASSRVVTTLAEAVAITRSIASHLQLTAKTA